MIRLGTWFWQLLPGNALARRVISGASRKTTHLWIRSGYLLGMVALIAAVMLFAGGVFGSGSISDLAKVGGRLFVIVAYTQVVLICLLSPLFMAGAIQQEQSGRTLDILLSTPMSNLQIVLGSLLGRLFFVLALLVSGLPLFSVLVLFGGVPLSSVMIAFGVSALTAILVGSVAVVLAVLRIGGRRAVMVFIVAIAAYLLVGLAVDQVIRWSRTAVEPTRAAATGPGGGAVTAEGPTQLQTVSAGQGLTTWVTPLHPLLVLESAVHTANYRPPAREEVAHLHPLVGAYLSQPMVSYAMVTLSTALGMLLAASSQLRRVNAVGGSRPFEPGGRTAGFLRRWLGRRPETVWKNPIAWKECRSRGSRMGSFLLRVGFPLASVAVTGALLWAYHNETLPALRTAEGRRLAPSEVLPAAVTVLLQIQFILIILVTLYIGAGSISREREDGTLDLLLATPITPGRFVWGKFRGLLSYVGAMAMGPVLCLLMVTGYSMAAWHLAWPGGRRQMEVLVQGIYDTGQWVTVEAPLVHPEAVLFFPFTMVAFLGMVAAVSMTWSIKARGVFQAVVPSLGVVAAVMLVTGICGIASAGRVPVLGAGFNAFSPFTLISVMLNPHEQASGFVTETGSISLFGRLVVIFSPLLAAIGYSVVIFVGIDSLIRNFDLTVRRLDADS